jgi:hypothetical protein
MSYSGQIQFNKAETDLVEAIQAITVQGNDGSEAEREARDMQVQSAKFATVSLLTSEAFADYTGELKVTFSGHANPGHQPKKGVSNDHVSITVALLP